VRERDAEGSWRCSLPRTVVKDFIPEEATLGLCPYTALYVTGLNLLQLTKVTTETAV